MRALLDINVLIALLDANHAHHAVASSWFIKNIPDYGWASCPLTQNGAIRIMGNPSYPNRQSTQSTISKLKSFCQTQWHEFWPDHLSLLDSDTFSENVVITSKQITDVYLLALAVRNNGTFVTIDSGIPSNAVVGFKAHHIIRIA
jgi:uncharacterized protein